MRTLRDLIDREAVGAVLLAVAVPFLFFHEKYQPELAVELGSTSIDVRLSDFAVLVVVVTAFVLAVRLGTRRLGPARILWIPGLALLLWLAFQAFRPASVDDALFEDHLVSYLKLVEYALLAVAVPLLVRRIQGPHDRPRDPRCLGSSGVGGCSRPVLRTRRLRRLECRLAPALVPRSPRPRCAQRDRRRVRGCRNPLRAKAAPGRTPGDDRTRRRSPRPHARGLTRSRWRVRARRSGSVDRRTTPLRPLAAPLPRRPRTRCRRRGWRDGDPRRLARGVRAFPGGARRRAAAGSRDILATDGAGLHRPQDLAGQPGSGRGGGSDRSASTSSSRISRTRTSASRTSSRSRSRRPGASGASRTCTSRCSRTRASSVCSSCSPSAAVGWCSRGEPWRTHRVPGQRERGWSCSAGC